MAVVPISPSEAKRLQPSPREQQLIELASQGYSDKEVALLLGLSRDTVQTYWKRLKAKYNVASRAQLVATLFGHQEEASAKLSGSLDQLTGVIDTFSEAVLIEDTEGHILVVNPAFCQLYGIDATPEQLRGANCREALLAHLGFFADGQAVLKSVAEALERGRKERDVPIPLADGRQMLRSYDPLYAGTSHVGNYWRYRIQDEQTPTAASSLHPEPTDILLQLPLALLWFDGDGRLRCNNPYAEALFGQLATHVGLTFEELFASVQFNRLRRSFRESLYNGADRSVVAPISSETSLARFCFQPHQGGVLLHVRELEDDRQALRQRIHYLKLHEILGRTLVDLIGADPNSTRTTLHRLCHELGDYFGGEHCSVHSIDAYGQPTGFDVSWTQGFLGAEHRLCFAPGDRGREWWAPRLQTEAHIFFDDLNSITEGTCSNVDRLVASGWRQALILPLRLHKMVVGYILVATRGSLQREVDPVMAPALGVLADGVSRAMQNC